METHATKLLAQSFCADVKATGGFAVCSLTFRDYFLLALGAAAL